jgi:hypothetical protein
MGLRVVADGDASAGLSGTVLFSILWAELVALIGTAATAAILRRAIRRALPRSPELADLAIERVDDQFGYAAPASFALANGPPPALRELVEELRPLLAELMGQVALLQLGRVPELRGWAPTSSPKA